MALFKYCIQATRCKLHTAKKWRLGVSFTLQWGIEHLESDSLVPLSGGGTPEVKSSTTKPSTQCKKRVFFLPVGGKQETTHQKTHALKIWLSAFHTNSMSGKGAKGLSAGKGAKG
eukprot:1140518-Pelagomonas_calceolata.AAC.3